MYSTLALSHSPAVRSTCSLLAPTADKTDADAEAEISLERLICRLYASARNTKLTNTRRAYIREPVAISVDTYNKPAVTFNLVWR